jgi:hypothetical protein
MGVSILYFLPLLQVEDERKNVGGGHGLYCCIQLKPQLGGRTAEAGGGQEGARGQVVKLKRLFYEISSPATN